MGRRYRSEPLRVPEEAEAVATLDSNGQLLAKDGAAVALPSANLGAHNHTSIHGTDGIGTDTAGSACTIQGGKGAGSGVGGSVKIQTAPHGSTGATPGTLADRMEIDEQGVLWLPNVTTAPTVGRADAIGLFVAAGVLKGIESDNTVIVYDNT